MAVVLKYFDIIGPCHFKQPLINQSSIHLSNYLDLDLDNVTFVDKNVLQRRAGLNPDLIRHSSDEQLQATRHNKILRAASLL